jgi:hypothetical protein
MYFTRKKYTIQDLDLGEIKEIEKLLNTRGTIITQEDLDNAYKIAPKIIYVC